jgi:hypothetical protein
MCINLKFHSIVDKDEDSPKPFSSQGIETLLELSFFHGLDFNAHKHKH